MAKKKWIQKAVAKPGSFTKWCKRHGHKGPNQTCVKHAKRVASKTGNKSLMGKANFAKRAKGGF